jgi:phospholipid transport system substrate-binding protein
MSVKSIDRRVALRLGAMAVAFMPLIGRTALGAEPAGAGSVAPVQSFGDALIATMKASRASFAQRFAMLAPAVDRAFDLDTILRVSVGPQWPSLPADQQTALRSAFRQYTIANFVANFDSYSGQSVQVAQDVRPTPSGDHVVTTRIAAPGESGTVLAYVMRQTPSGWKAVDVLADGSISRVATQRSDFRSLLQSGGGSALVSSLQSKVSALSGGALA